MCLAPNSGVAVRRTHGTLPTISHAGWESLEWHTAPKDIAKLSLPSTPGRHWLSHVCPRLLDRPDGLPAALPLCWGGFHTLGGHIACVVVPSGHF